MTQKEDIKKIHEMIREIAPSTSMGDFGLKEQLCAELLKWKEEQLIEKACEWLKENIYHHVYECGDRLGFPTAVFIEQFKKAMEE